jgi:hypothetical protein
MSEDRNGYVKRPAHFSEASEISLLIAESLEKKKVI